MKEKDSGHIYTGKMSPSLLSFVVLNNSTSKNVRLKGYDERAE